jgi:hypothetical protein
MRSDESIAELHRFTRQQHQSIVQECTESIFQLGSSMTGELEVMSSSVESVQEQLDVLKESIASQVNERSTQSVTPGILAAAVAALERHVDEYLPPPSTRLSFSPSQNFNARTDSNRSRAVIELRMNQDCEERERKLDVLDAQVSRLYRTNKDAA